MSVATRSVPASDDPRRRPGLRVRKKRATRRAIHRAALELAAAHGVEQVTVAQIAERAGVSTRTLFNYFPTREDAFVGVDPGRTDRLCREFLAQPAQWGTMQAWQATLGEYLSELAEDPHLWQLRRQVAKSSPQLWARMMGSGTATEQAMVEAAIQRSGVDPQQDPSPVVDSFVAFAVVRAAMWQHARSGFQGDLTARLEAAFAQLNRERCHGECHAERNDD